MSVCLFGCVRSQLQRVGSSFLTRNRTRGLCVGSTEPQPLDQQGGPCILIFLCPFSSLFTPQFKGFAAPTTRRPCVRRVAFLSALLLTLLAKRAWAASLASSPCRPSGWPLPTRGKATPGPSLAATPTPYPHLWLLGCLCQRVSSGSVYASVPLSVSRSLPFNLHVSFFSLGVSFCLLLPLPGLAQAPTPQVSVACCACWSVPLDPPPWVSVLTRLPGSLFVPSYSLLSLSPAAALPLHLPICGCLHLSAVLSLISLSLSLHLYACLSETYVSL